MDNISLKMERWRYPRFFTDEISGDTAFVRGEDARHISVVLRMRAGDIAVLCDGKGTDLLSRLVTAGKDCCEFRVAERSRNLAEPSVRLRLFQAMPKGDKMDFIVQKAVECGASEIVPMLSKRCVSSPDAAALAKKAARWRRIALEAAKQCGRGVVPSVADAVRFADIPALCPAEHTRILFYECAETPLAKAVPSFSQSIDIVIGSEGGFEREEAEQLAATGFAQVSLGKRILRCETAPIAAVSILMNITGNM